MAERRMFAKSVVNSDLFLDMPLSSQALYFHLGMAADDEGFLNAPKRVQRSIGATDDDMRILISKGFIIAFESGVVVVRHWKVNNYLQKDRIKPSQCIEAAEVRENDRREYEIQQRLIEVEAVVKTDNKRAFGDLGNVRLTDEEFSKLVDQFGEPEAMRRIDTLGDYMASRGKRYKSHYATIRAWARKDGAAKPEQRYGGAF